MTRDEMIDAMAKAICNQVSPCAYDRECRSLFLSCAEQRRREAVAALAALPGPVMPEKPKGIIMDQLLMLDFASRGWRTEKIYLAIRGALIAEVRG